MRASVIRKGQVLENLRNTRVSVRPSCCCARRAASLDDRGVRERALKDALADHLPVFGLDDVDD